SSASFSVGVGSPCGSKAGGEPLLMKFCQNRDMFCALAVKPRSVDLLHSKRLGQGREDVCPLASGNLPTFNEIAAPLKPLPLTRRVSEVAAKSLAHASG